MDMKTYADKINQQFTSGASNLVSLQQRLNDALALNPVFAKMLDGAVDEFKRRNKQWKSFSDLTLCNAIPVKMSEVVIDTTLQRPLNIRHIIKILDHFSQSMVMPIQVYKEVPPGDEWIAWDGQHTAITLYIIATKVFEKNGFIKIELALAKGKKDYDKRKKILNKEHAKEIKNY